MRKLKPNQLGHWCSFCEKEARKRATYTNSGFMQKYACTDHTKELEAWEHKDRGTDHLTEADYQTWFNV